MSQFAQEGLADWAAPILAGAVTTLQIAFAAYLSNYKTFDL